MFKKLRDPRNPRIITFYYIYHLITAIKCTFTNRFFEFIMLLGWTQ